MVISHGGGRICLEASPAVQRQAGLGRYTSGLIRGLLITDPYGNYAISYNQARHARPAPPLDRLPCYTSPLGNKAWRLGNALTYLGVPLMDSFFSGVALYHSTGHLMPRLPSVRTVFTLHDLIPLQFPEYHLPMNRVFLRVMLPLFLRQADAIIAVSENTRRDAAILLGTDPRRITVIAEGVDPHFKPVTNSRRLDAVRATYGLPETFILCVSTIEPRKNHKMLLEAYSALREHNSDLRLVLVGERGWLYHDFLATLDRSGLTSGVSMIGHVQDGDLPALLSAATVFAFPSLYEGFGLPPLEAMACGTAVVCSDAASLPEVVGDAALLCGPRDTDAWMRALSLVLDDVRIRTDLQERGRERASRFTWEAAALATRTVYDRVLE